jgi:hypothetical protein
MRTLFLLLLSVGFGFAQPFLVCTPVPKTDPSMPITNYTLTGLLAAPLTVPATINADGSAQLHLDIAKANAGLPLANGSYTVSVSATNARGAGAASAPFTFTLPYPANLPGAPGSLSLSPL